MLGLEFLIAGDIIRTVVVAHSLADILSLGLLVLIRTVLVFTIHLELEGRWPWQPATEKSHTKIDDKQHSIWIRGSDLRIIFYVLIYGRHDSRNRSSCRRKYRRC